MIINFLSKIPSIILKPLTFLFCLLVWLGFLYFSVYIGIDAAVIIIGNDVAVVILFFLLFLLIIPFLLHKGTKWISDAIQEFNVIKNKSIIAKTNMPRLCLDMLEASQQKYKYNNFQIKLNNYSDWITYQSSQNRKIPLEKLINDKELKHLGTGTFITFDSVHIAQNKFLDSLFHTNIILGLLGQMSVIEVNLLSDFNIDENYENIQLRIKIIRGIDMFEIRYDLDACDKPAFQEIVFLKNMYGITYLERQASDEQIVNVINFMKKFIKKTRKLIR